MSWTLEFTTKARQEISSLDPPVRRQLESDLLGLLQDPTNGKLLHGRLKGIRSWRSGDYRILYGIQSADWQIIVYRVGHRREVYR